MSRQERDAYAPISFVEIGVLIAVGVVVGAAAWPQILAFLRWIFSR